MSNLTPEALTSALKSNKTYKQTQKYLKQLKQGNLQVLEAVNQAFSSIIASQKIELMSKLQVLRMYKDIFMAGNMDIFDQLDPEIEETIISAAAYNANFKPKNKNDNRGGMYFVDTENRQKNTDSLTIGNSFVLFATEIIKNFGQWLSEYSDGSASRFKESYDQLQKLGVPFNTNIYFKPEEKQQFLKNYEKWLSSQQQQQDAGQNKKTEVKEKKTIKKVEFRQQTTARKQSPQKSDNQERQRQRIQQQKLKRQSEYKIKIEQLKNLLENRQKHIMELNSRLESKNIQLQSYKEQKSKQVQKGKQKIEQLTRELSQLEKSNEKNKTQQARQREDHMRKLQNQKNETEKQKNRISLLLRDAMSKIELLQKNLQQSYQQNKAHEAKLSQQQETISQLQQANNKAMQGSKVSQQIQASLKKQKQLREVLEAEVRKLKNADLENIQSISKLQSQIVGLKKQNQSLIAQLQQNCEVTKPVSSEQSPKFILQQPQADEKSENSNKPEISFLQRPSTSTFTMSLSKLQPPKPTQQAQFYRQASSTSNSFYQTGAPQHRKTTTSLHKTETCQFKMFQKQRQIKDSTNNFYARTENGFAAGLHKKHMNVRSPKSIPTSVFPFIQQYYAPVKIGPSAHFRACCVLQQARSSPFFNDELIEVRIVKSNNQACLNQYQLSLRNLQVTPFTLNIWSDSPQTSISTDSTNNTKVAGFSQARISLQTKTTNLNFRHPTINIHILCNSQAHHYKLPIPLTLWNLSILTQNPRELQKFQKYSQTQYRRHRSERKLINKCIDSLASAFKQVQFVMKSPGVSSACILVYFPAIAEIKLKLTLTQTNSYCQFETEFLSGCKISQAFSKVILQNLMFIFC